MEGAVYEWNIFTSKRIRENVEKACSYTGVSVTADNKTMYTVGTDKRIKELADFEVKSSYLKQGYWNVNSEVAFFLYSWCDHVLYSTLDIYL